jgi:hypothetical protein
MPCNHCKWLGDAHLSSLLRINQQKTKMFQYAICTAICVIHLLPLGRQVGKSAVLFEISMQLRISSISLPLVENTVGCVAKCRVVVLQ